MQAIEFQSTISGGIIKMPERYRNKQYRNARVIVLANEMTKTKNFTDSSLILPVDDTEKIHFASEAVLAKDWLTKHEDEVWKSL